LHREFWIRAEASSLIPTKWGKGVVKAEKKKENPLQNIFPSRKEILLMTHDSIGKVQMNVTVPHHQKGPALSC
jgi:hypothetical protein